MIVAGMGGGMATKILDQIEKSRDCSLADFIGSLSIDLLGRSQAAKIVKLGVDTVTDWLGITTKQLSNFSGFGVTKAKRIVQGVNGNRKLIQGLAKILNIQATKKKPTGGLLAGLSFCFTGTMDKPRKDLEAMAEDAGGQLRSVSQELSFLVIADSNSTSSKAEKARKKKVKMITEEEFLRMV